MTAVSTFVWRATEYQLEPDALAAELVIFSTVIVWLLKIPDSVKASDGVNWMLRNAPDVLKML